MSGGLTWAIKNGDIDEVKKFVNIENINSTFVRRTALHYAADYGQYEVAAWLLSMGADVNAVDEFGIAPLLAAVWESHVDVIQLLVDKGASREIKDPNGTPLIDCTESEDVKKILLA